MLERLSGEPIRPVLLGLAGSQERTSREILPSMAK